MPRKQNRRSISVKGLTYQRISKHVAKTGQTKSGFVEAVIEEALGAMTDEERQKFGEALKSSDKGSEAIIVAAKEPHDAQEATPDPPDQVRESAPRPAPVIEPIPKPAVEPEVKPVIEPVYEPKPEPAREVAPEPEPERNKIWDNPHNRGTPVESKPDEPEKVPEGFEDYIPPILEF